MITATVLEKESSLCDWDGTPLPVISLQGEEEDQYLGEWIGQTLSERDYRWSTRLDRRGGVA